MEKFDVTGFTPNALVEEITDIVQAKVQTNNRHFFSLQVIFMLAQMATMQRANIFYPGRGKLPLNVYAINLAPSGAGKDHSTNILEKNVCHLFRERFLKSTLEINLHTNLTNIATKLASARGEDPDEVYKQLQATYRDLGEFLYSFDSGTGPAIKAFRYKLMLAGLGSVNLIMNEVGSNLSGNTEIMNMFLELYDLGFIKQKLTKNTKDNVRAPDLVGSTPTNILLYGTPSKLLDGAKVEEEFKDFLETGYARRAFFGYVKGYRQGTSNVALEEQYQNLIDTQTSKAPDKVSAYLEKFASSSKSNITISVPKSPMLLLLDYKNFCERVASTIPEHSALIKTELLHRYFKCFKLAGIFAYFADREELTIEDVQSAILFTEESAIHFERVVSQEKAYQRVANYICSIGTPVTHTDLMNALPCYTGSRAQRQEIMTLALTWAYQNQKIITIRTENEIDFIEGKALQATDLDKVTFSCSDHIAENYQNMTAPFFKMKAMLLTNGLHWCVRQTATGRRKAEDMHTKFCLIALDVENSASLGEVQELLKEYTYIIHTTARHRTEGHGDRFRVILPLSHMLDLTREDYTVFMENIYNWLPFNVDEATKDFARKWSTNSGEYYENVGKLLDPMPFIPRTLPNREMSSYLSRHSDLTGLERWMLNTAISKGRNNCLLRYAKVLVDRGLPYQEIASKVLTLNRRFTSPLQESEIHSTVLKTIRSDIGE